MPKQIAFVIVCLFTIVLFGPDARSQSKEEEEAAKRQSDYAKDLVKYERDCGISPPVTPLDPMHCRYDGLTQFEIKPEDEPLLKDGDVRRARAFRIGAQIIDGKPVGGKVLVGLAVGWSDAEKLKAMNSRLGTAAETSDDGKYCTWYHNTHNQAAKNSFHYMPVNKPGNSREREKITMALSAELDDMINCLNSSSYVALGCEGQRHRGPSIFGMVLTFSGCSPEQSEYLVCRLWGRNGIERDDRIALNQKVFELKKTPTRRGPMISEGTPSETYGERFARAFTPLTPPARQLQPLPILPMAEPFDSIFRSIRGSSSQ